LLALCWSVIAHSKSKVKLVHHRHYRGVSWSPEGIIRTTSCNNLLPQGSAMKCKPRSNFLLSICGTSFTKPSFLFYILLCLLSVSGSGYCSKAAFPRDSVRTPKQVSLPQKPSQSVDFEADASRWLSRIGIGASPHHKAIVKPRQQKWVAAMLRFFVRHFWCASILSRVIIGRELHNLRDCLWAFCLSWLP
jgi:hypothetical protein